MKNNSNVLKEIRKALGDPFELKDSEIDSFLSRYDAGEINTPPMPSHLLPDLISHNIGRGINPIHSISDIPNDSLNDQITNRQNQ